MKRCDRIAEIQEDCWRLKNVKTGQEEISLGEKETSTWQKSDIVGEKVNFVGGNKFIRHVAPLWCGH